MRNRYLTVRTVLCLGFCIVIFSSWDAVYPPYVINGYKHAIYLDAVYSNGERGDVFLEPGISFVERHKGYTYASMKVYSEDEVLLAEYPEDVITELKAKSFGDHEFWVLNERGIFLVPEPCCQLNYNWRPLTTTFLRFFSMRS